MIHGLHTIIYSDDADATRGFLSDVLGWPSIDAGGGWMIYRTPPAEMGVHPTVSEDRDQWAEAPHHQVSLMCDDIAAAVDELRAKGAEITGEVEDEGWGLVTHFTLPGAGAMMLYQPRHAVAHSLPS